MKSTTAAENHYFKQLEGIRHRASLDEGRSVEEKPVFYKNLEKVSKRGYRIVIQNNFEQDVAEVSRAIAGIAAAAEQNTTCLREVGIARPNAEAQARREKAVRANPLIMLNCGGKTDVY